jgi:hypothetical protein
MTSDNSPENTRRSWLGSLMFGLLYPAILGTLFYSLLPEALKVVRSPTELSALQGVKLLIAVLLVAHFLVDFYFTQQVALKTKYSRRLFLLDLAIVLALFVAYETVHLDDRAREPEVRWVAGAMVVSYVLFRIWELSLRRVIGKSRGLMVYETVIAILFALIAVWPNVYALAGALVLSAVLMYSIGGPVVERFHRRQTQ